MNFVAVDPNDPDDPNLSAYQSVVNASPESSGDNIISIEPFGSPNLVNGNRANASHPAGSNYRKTVKEEFIAGNGKPQVRKMRKSGNLAYVSSTDNGEVAVHEIFHNFGLGDRYSDGVAYWLISPDGSKKLIKVNGITQKGFATDIMSTGESTFSQTHIDNLVNTALSIKTKTGKSHFIMGKKVDESSIRDWKSAVNSYKQGQLKYEKAPKQHQND